MKKQNDIIECLKLFAVFCKIGAVTFGGGLAMLPILERELAEKRDWTTKEQLLDYYAIGQATPGIIAINVATFIGYTRKGILGAICATTGIVFPSLVIIMSLAHFISNFSENKFVQKALNGINVAVTALLTKAVWQFSKKSVKNIFSFIVFITSFICIYFFNIPTIIIIFFAALLVIFLFILNKKKDLQNLNKDNK